MSATVAVVPSLTAVDYFRAKLAYELNAHGLKPLMEKNAVVLLDVRDAASFALEHIPGALNIPLADLSKNLMNLPKDRMIVTYCWNISCFSAPKAALELAQKGFMVQALCGGIADWKNAGFPVELGK